MRYQEWMRRLITDKGSLGVWFEFWGPVHEHPSYAGLLALVKKHGGDEGTTKFYITDSLIPDVIQAAGAIEYTVGKIEDLMKAAQQWADEQIPRSHLQEPRPTRGRHIGTEHLPMVAWEYGNLLAWVRALEDRMRRDHKGGDLGLLPALDPNHPAAPEIWELWRKFKSTNLLKDVRNQAALSLHAGAIHHAGATADLKDNGRVVVRIPDPLMRKVGAREELIFDQGRDILTYSETLLMAVENLVDAMLNVFERWTLDRYVTTSL